MMSADYDPFFRLPTELCCTILRDWLLLHSVVRLDSAVCDTVKRSLLLNTIFASSQCIVTPRLYTYSQRDIFDWYNNRKVRTSGIMLAWDVDDGIREYLRVYGNTILKLDLCKCDILAYLPLLRSYCKSLRCLQFEVVGGFCLGDLVPFLNSRLEALDISLLEVSNGSIENLVSQCPRITHLALPIYNYSSTIFDDILGRNFKHLKFLSVSNTSVTDAMLISIAEHNSDTLEEFHMEYCDEVMGRGFSALLQKCTKLHTAHITYSEDTFVDFDFSLLSNLTELHIINQNDSQGYLTSLVKHCTKVERFVIDWRDSPPRVRYSRLFHLKELTAQRLPNLKVLSPFGMPQSEMDAFSKMRPDVVINLNFNVLWWSFFDMLF